MTPIDAESSQTTLIAESAVNILLDRIKQRVRKQHGWFLGAIQDLDETMWSSMPTPTAPSIGWHAWHTARTEDISQAKLSTEPARWLEPGYRDQDVLPNELWAIDRYVEQWGLDRSQLGWAESGTEANCSALLPGKALVLPYVRRVFARLDQGLESIDEQRLQMSLYAQAGERLAVGADLEPSVAEELIFTIAHSGRHLGMIEALRGGFGMQGSATN